MQLLATLANNQVDTQMLNAEVHPKVTEEGEWPRDFQLPLTVEEILCFDGTYAQFLSLTSRSELTSNHKIMP
jgi:hypothetical protein